MDTAYFACGCFWGVQYLFQQLPGVVETSVGYMGGLTDSPSYEDVCSGTSGHREAIKVMYNPQEISYHDLLITFFEIHDFQQTDGQGPDIGDQYLSVIFTINDTQKQQARDLLNQLIAMGGVSARHTDHCCKPILAGRKLSSKLLSKNRKKPYCHVRRKIFR